MEVLPMRLDEIWGSFMKFLFVDFVASNGLVQSATGLDRVALQKGEIGPGKSSLR